MSYSLIAFIGILLLLFILFKLFGWSIKLFFRMLINAIIGAVMLIVFDFVFADIFNLEIFRIGINWITAIVTGVLGVPGVILLLILKLLL